MDTNEKYVVTPDNLEDVVFGPGVTITKSFHVGEGKAGEIDFSDVKVHLEGMTVGQAIDWIFPGQSARVKIQGIARNLDRSAALVLKKAWESDGLFLRDYSTSRRGRGKKVTDPRVLLAQCTPEQRKALFKEYEKELSE